MQAWLLSIHPNTAVCADPLADYGMEDVSFLLEANERELEQALEVVGMKPLHRTPVLKRFRQLKKGDMQ
jgi:hypothetical protein